MPHTPQNFGFDHFGVSFECGDVAGYQVCAQSCPSRAAHALHQGRARPVLTCAGRRQLPQPLHRPSTAPIHLCNRTHASPPTAHLLHQRLPGEITLCIRHWLEVINSCEALTAAVPGAACVEDIQGRDLPAYRSSDNKVTTASFNRGMFSLGFFCRQVLLNANQFTLTSSCGSSHSATKASVAPSFLTCFHQHQFIVSKILLFMPPLPAAAVCVWQLS